MSWHGSVGSSLCRLYPEAHSPTHAAGPAPVHCWHAPAHSEGTERRGWQAVDDGMGVGGGCAREFDAAIITVIPVPQPLGKHYAGAISQRLTFYSVGYKNFGEVCSQIG